MIYILSGNIETAKSSTLLKWTEERNDIFGILTPRNEDNIRYILDVGSKECLEMQKEKPCYINWVIPLAKRYF